MLNPIRVSDQVQSSAEWPQHLTASQRQARETFDLDAALAALPKDTARALPVNLKGAAGTRLRADLVSDISDDLLREVARDTLGAKRCSQQYLDALRVVLGNQADAERRGYVLEMNRRVSFVPENVMRTILGQMRAAGVCFSAPVGLGTGRRQIVQCYGKHRPECTEVNAAAELERMYREHEGEGWAEAPWMSIPADELPY